MAGNIQGLTVVINGDATPLTRAMRQLRAEATTLRSHMTALNKLLKFDPASTVLLTRQQQLLNAQLRQTAGQYAVAAKANEEYAARSATLTAAERRQWEARQRDLTQAELQYAQLTAAAVEYGAAANASTLAAAGRLQGVSTALSKVSTGFLVAGASAGVFLGLSVKAAYDFDQSFAGVRKTIIATDEEYEKLAKSTREIALTKPIDVNDVNEIMMYAGQLGIANKYLTTFASTMADLDVATDMNLEEGSMQLARFANIVGMSQGDVDRLGATIVDLGNNSATTESQIMLMAMRIAGTGSNLGMTASDVLALAATLSSLGIQAEMGGNAISTIMRRIDKDVALNNATLETWASVAGMSADEFKRAWTSDVTGTLLAVMGGMGEFQDEGNNLNVLLDELGISYMRQVDTLQRFSRAQELGTSLVERAGVAWDENTALVREATQRYDTAASKTQMMKNAFNELGISIGNEILPAFKDVVLSVTGAIQSFAKMDDGTKSLVINMGSFTVAAALAVRAAQGVTGGLASLIKGYASLKTRLVEATVCQRTYAELMIAENGVLDANTIAKLRNVEAEVASQRAKAATLREYAAGLTAKGLDTEATTVLAMAEQLEARAASSESAAQQLATASAIEGATSKGILSVATEFLTASTMKLSVALGVSNGMLLGIGAAVGVAAVVLAALGKAAYEAVDPMNDLTRASQEQADSIARHEAEYQELVAAEGLHSESAIRAKAALDEERAEFESTSLTVGEFTRNLEDAAEDQRKLSQSCAEALDDVGKEAATIWNLVDSIDSLSATAAASPDDMRKLIVQVEALNDLMPELGLTVDSTTGAVESQAGAWHELADEAARTKIAEQAMENYTTLVGEMETAQRNATAAYDEMSDTAKESFTWAEDSTAALSAADLQAIRNYNLAKQTLDEVTADMEENLRIVTEYTSRQHALSLALEELATYTGEAASEQERAAEIAQKYTELLGVEITGEEVLAAAQADKAQRAIEAAQATEEMTEAISGLNETNAAFAKTLADSGLSVDELAQRLEDAGVSADEFQQAVNDVADKVTDGFNRIEADSDKTLGAFMDNLAHNRQVTEQWASNVQTCYDRAGTSYQAEFVDALVSYGPEAAGAIAELANVSDEEFDRMAREFQEAGYSAVRTGLVTTGALSEQARIGRNNITNNASQAGNNVLGSIAAMRAGIEQRAPAIRGAIDTVAANIASVNRHSGSMHGWGSGSVSSLASGMQSARGNVVNAASNIANAASRMTPGNTWNWGYDAANGFASGINAARWNVISAANNIANAVWSILHHSVPEEGPLRNGGKGEAGWGQELVGNLVEGIESREGQLRAVIMSLASDISDPFELAVEGGNTWLNGRNAGRVDWLSAGQSRHDGPVRTVSVTADITGNNFFIREEADVDRVAQAIADKVNREVALA